MPKINARSNCRLCLRADLELVMRLEPIPLSENYQRDATLAKKADLYPLDLHICLSCGHVQQLDVIDPSILWKDYTYYSGEAVGMSKHFNDIANEIMSDYLPDCCSLVIDIGSNDGSLLLPFKRAGHSVLGIDPAVEVALKASQEGIPTFPELMSKQLAERIRLLHGTAQLVCMFNAFAHVDDMDELLRSIKVVLADDGLFVFEAQYLLDVIEHTLIATIFHEHISHHSVLPLQDFFSRHGMELIHVKRSSIQHGSIIGYVQFVGGVRARQKSVDVVVKGELSYGIRDKGTLKKFSDDFNSQKLCVEKMVKFWSASGFKIAAYGAARSGPSLISQFNLSHIIRRIYDNHTEKVGRFSPGHGIPIVPTSGLMTDFPDVTLILAWVHAESILKTERDYIDRGGTFVILCPRLRLINKKGVIHINHENVDILFSLFSNGTTT